MNSATLVKKLWNYCIVLRDDGTNYGDYVKQLTYLLFLKVADERSRPPYKQEGLIAKTYAWPTLLAKDGERGDRSKDLRGMHESLSMVSGLLWMARNPIGIQ